MFQSPECRTRFRQLIGAIGRNNDDGGGAISRGGGGSTSATLSISRAVSPAENAGSSAGARPRRSRRRVRGEGEGLPIGKKISSEINHPGARPRSPARQAGPEGPGGPGGGVEGRDTGLARLRLPRENLLPIFFFLH